MNSIISKSINPLSVNSKIIFSSISQIPSLKRNLSCINNISSTSTSLLFNGQNLLINNSTFSNDIHSQLNCKNNLRLYSQKAKKDEKDEKNDKVENNEKKTEETKKPEENNSKSKETEEKKEKEMDPSVKKLLTEKDKKISDLQDAYKRALADTENIRERTRKEIQKATQFAIQKFAKDLLDTSDVLKMALDSVPEKMREDKSNNILYSLYTGVSMTRVQLLNSFKRHGLEVFNPMGEKFDANKHQAMFQTVIPDKEPGIIISVQKEGYLLNGRILRPAQVGIVKEKEEEEKKK